MRSAFPHFFLRYRIFPAFWFVLFRRLVSDHLPISFFYPRWSMTQNFAASLEIGEKNRFSFSSTSRIFVINKCDDRVCAKDWVSSKSIKIVPGHRSTGEAGAVGGAPQTAHRAQHPRHRNRTLAPSVTMEYTREDMLCYCTDKWDVVWWWMTHKQYFQVFYMCAEVKK